MFVTPVLRARGRPFADATPGDTPDPGTHKGHPPAAHPPRSSPPVRHCAGQPDSGYRRWPGWMLPYPFRLHFPDLTPTSCDRGQENSSSTEQHPARQKQGSKIKVKIVGEP